MNWQCENIDLLWLLTAIPVFLVIFFIRHKSRNDKLAKLGTDKTLKRSFNEQAIPRLMIKNSFLIIAVAFLIIAFANPQVKSKVEKVKIKGSEIIIALDVSNSMKADDIKPNRLEKARLEITKLLQNIKNDKVGLIVFAGKSFLTVPLTTDYTVVNMYLKSVDTDVISTQGTDIGGAIAMAAESFSQDRKSDKAIILITDGENHEEDAIENAKTASKDGIQIHTIGLGKTTGVPIPIIDRYGRKEFRKDRDGNVVVSKLNEQLLNEIAQIGEGKFVVANGFSFGLEDIYKELKGMKKQEFDEKQIVSYEDDYQFYLWFGLAFLFIEMIILPKKNKWLSRIKLDKLKV